MKSVCRVLLAFLVLLQQQPVFAQVGSPMPVPHIQFHDVNGAPLAGGFVYTCTAGAACTSSTIGGPPTANGLATYKDAIGTANTNPVVLDAGGFGDFWLGLTGAYKIVVQDANGVQQSSVDSVPAADLYSTPALAALRASLAAASGSTLIGYQAPGTTSVPRTVAAKLADESSALDYGTTAGIATAVTACGSSRCLVTVPAGDSSSEIVPGAQTASISLQPVPATTPGNVSIFDERYGDYRTFVNPLGSNSASNGRYAMQWNGNFYLPGSVNGTSFGLINRNMFALDGGSNMLFNGVINKSNYNPEFDILSGFTPGQKINTVHELFTYSVGDSLNESNFQECWGGINSAGDEGCEVGDYEVAQAGVEYTGTVTASTATTVTILPTQGQNTQGVGRWLLDGTSGVISAGSISAITNPGGPPSTITGSGTSWPVSTVSATLGTPVGAPGVYTVTPATYTIGSASNISVSSQVCVYDTAGFEIVQPSAVSGSSFTATFTYPHTASSMISAGGLCGYFLAPDADLMTSASLPLLIGITGTLHYAWPMAVSTSATSAQVWASAQGAYQQFQLLTQWSASGTNTYRMYPGGVVLGVQQNGGLTNTLTLSNAAAFAPGDNAFETEYPAMHVSIGNFIAQKMFPSPGSAASSFRTDEMFGVWNGNDAFGFIANYTPTTLYQGGGGVLTPPAFTSVYGLFRNGWSFQYAPGQALLQVGCPVGGCATGVVPFLQPSNASGSDILQYLESGTAAGRCWEFTAGSQTQTFTLCGNGALGTPSLAAATTITAGASVSAPVVNATTHQAGGINGFTGTKTAGACVLTISGGIITNVTGC